MRTGGGMSDFEREEEMPVGAMLATAVVVWFGIVGIWVAVFG